MRIKFKRQYDIIDGPNKDRLFDACKYAYGCKIGRITVRIPVDFSVAAGYTLPKSNPAAGYIRMDIRDVRITGIEHEDDSGESFTLRGFCQADLNSLGESKPYGFEATYSTKARKGTITLIE